MSLKHIPGGFLYTRDVCKTLCPLKIFLSQMFCTTGLASSNKLHKCMKKKFIFGKCYLDNLKHFWHILHFNPKLIWFLCSPGRMCGPSLRKVGKGILEVLIGNEKVTDGQTDRQYALSSSKGVIKIHC